MRKLLPGKLREGRIRSGRLASPDTFGPTGAFVVQGPCGEKLRIISSSGEVAEGDRWEHVSVSIERRCPNWREMSFVKKLFWEDDEAVIQIHPPRSEYVNNHPNCLHLWRPIDGIFPLPPSILVGIKELGVVTREQALALAP